MSDLNREAEGVHGFSVMERAHVEIHGMTEVVSFDENRVVLETTSGNMSVEGSDLRVNILDVREGTVSVDGHIDGIFYAESNPDSPSRGFFGRLFH